MISSGIPRHRSRTTEPPEGEIYALVAEDEPLTRAVVVENLRRWGYRVLTAEDGGQACQALLAHPEIRLLITDWRMPGCGGGELCRMARDLERPRYLHILALTVRSSRGEGLQAIQAGADAFLIKPVDPSELEAQVRVARRILDLDELNAQRIAELDAIDRRVRLDMEAATRVQLSFLPEAILQTSGFRCASIFQSSRHVAGDMFNQMDLGQGKLAGYVLDVSGHGTQAALLSVSIQMLLESLGRTRGCFGGAAPEPGGEVSLDDPAAVLRMLNRRFPVMRQSGQYFTMIYGVLDPAERVFRYARAGHPWPVLVDSRGARLLKGSAGSALGVFSEIRVDSAVLHLAPGDLVVFYSDGLTEARSALNRHEEFATSRLLASLERTRGQGVIAAVADLEQALREFVGDQEPHDDVTVLGMELLGS